MVVAALDHHEQVHRVGAPHGLGRLVGRRCMVIKHCFVMPLKKIPIKISVAQSKFDGRVAACLTLHVFFFDISFEINKKMVEVSNVVNRI